MALVERLMHDPSESENRYIAVHEFFAAVTELMTGHLTSSQVQNYYAMTTEDLVDWNAVVALMPPVGETANRAIFMHRIHAVFLLGESKVPTYSTPSEVRVRLGI